MFMIKDPFAEEGEQDYGLGYSISENPYDDGTDGHAGWLIGWRKAKEREERVEREACKKLQE
jgi:ribosome modulation factor